MKKAHHKPNAGEDLNIPKNLFMSSCRRIGLTPPKSKLRTSLSQTPSPLAAPKIKVTPEKSLYNKIKADPDPGPSLPTESVKAKIKSPIANFNCRLKNEKNESKFRRKPSTNVEPVITKSPPSLIIKNNVNCNSSPAVQIIDSTADTNLIIEDQTTLTPILNTGIRLSNDPIEIQKIEKLDSPTSVSVPKIESTEDNQPVDENEEENRSSPMSLTPPVSTISDFNFMGTPTSSMTEPRIQLKRSLSVTKNNTLKSKQKIAESSPHKKKSRILNKSSFSSQNSKLSQSSISQNSLDYDSDEDFAAKPLKRKSSNLKTKTKAEQNQDSKAIEREIEETKNRLRAKMEELDALKRNSEDVKNRELANLIVTWRTACQRALNELLEINSKRGDRKVDMVELLDLLHIPHNLVRYSEEDMCFY